MHEKERFALGFFSFLKRRKNAIISCYEILIIMSIMTICDLTEEGEGYYISTGAAITSLVGKGERGGGGVISN